MTSPLIGERWNLLQWNSGSPKWHFSGETPDKPNQTVASSSSGDKAFLSPGGNCSEWKLGGWWNKKIIPHNASANQFDGKDSHDTLKRGDFGQYFQERWIKSSDVSMHMWVEHGHPSQKHDFNLNNYPRRKTKIPLHTFKTRIIFSRRVRNTNKFASWFLLVSESKLPESSGWTIANGKNYNEKTWNLSHHHHQKCHKNPTTGHKPLQARFVTGKRNTGNL